MADSQPNRRKSGWAQRWPVRIAIFLQSSSAARSSGWTFSMVKVMIGPLRGDVPMILRSGMRSSVSVANDNRCCSHAAAALRPIFRENRWRLSAQSPKRSWAYPPQSAGAAPGRCSFQNRRDRPWHRRPAAEASPSDALFYRRGRRCRSDHSTYGRKKHRNRHRAPARRRAYEAPPARRRQERRRLPVAPLARFRESAQ